MIRILISLMVVLLLSNFQEIGGRQEEMVKAVYGFSKGLKPFKGKDPGKVVDILQSWGVNAVFGGYDDTAFVEALHRKGMKVYAEVAIFVGEEYWKKYPESRPINSDGEPIEKDEWYAGVTPTIEEIRKERLEAIKKLVSETDVDGIWLDFIRWPCHWESPSPRLEDTSFDPITLKKFVEETGTVIPPELSEAEEKAHWILENRLDSWIRWKCEQITSFVKDAREILKRAGEEKLLGLFNVPWRRSDYKDAIRRIIGQDYEALGRYVDVFSPMVYHLMCGRDVGWISDVTSHVHKQSGRSVWPIVQAVSEPKKLSGEEFEKSMEAALSVKGSGGVIVFTLRHVLEERKVENLRRVFLKTESGG